MTIGVIAKCNYTELRMNPTTNSTSAGTLVAGERVMIDKEHSAKGWFKAYTESGAEGYVIRRFVEEE